MFRISLYVFVFGFAVLNMSCKPSGEDKKVADTIDIDSLLNIRYSKLLKYPVDSMAFPRSYNVATNTIKKVPSKDWTSGFFVGNLWQIYALTGDDAYKKRAEQWTPLVEREKLNNRTHDMGFKVFCSFGNGLKANKNDYYKNVIIKSAQTLSTRFNENVGSIRSWDFNKDIWEFPVIIDNMMNLELLFEATKITKDSSFHKMAVTHANTTLRNHFRDDNSTYHVVVYDTINGSVKQKVTHQGINDESAWARGQAWAIYGYTMAYRYTKNADYLKQAEETANFFIDHPNLPADGIPYWDFDDPKVPNAPRDVSAGTVVASALIELYAYTQNEKYLNHSKKVIDQLQSENYILEAGIEAPFILKHSTGNWPKNDEIDEPIVYADYYFLEALLRLKAL
ncbi:glycoside hydrolase family 88 protein [Sungkyunkwania multivorans]|uniref:Glycoside hydrolase family 88 protein n=1 Tax=Sungkyunkwania multivorans TaxID=1173618 RepID=A0ABW3CV67_9FLAO